MELIRSIYSSFVKPKKQAILFLVCGGIAALSNIISRYLLFFVYNYTVSIILAHFIGMIIAFVLFKLIVFQVANKSNLLREIVYFVLVNLLGLVQTLIISTFLAEFLFPLTHFTFFPYDIAHGIAVSSLTITSYFLHKHFTFAKK